MGRFEYSGDIRDPTWCTGCCDHDNVQAKCCMVVEPTLYMYCLAIACMYVCMYVTVSIKRLTIPGG